MQCVFSWLWIHWICSQSSYKLEFLPHFHLPPLHGSFSPHGGHKSQRLSGRLSTAQLLCVSVCVCVCVCRWAWAPGGGEGPHACISICVYVYSKNRHSRAWGGGPSGWVDCLETIERNTDRRLQQIECFCLWQTRFFCGNKQRLYKDKYSLTGRKTCPKHFRWAATPMTEASSHVIF